MKVITRFHIAQLCIMVFVAVMMTGCDGTKFVSDGNYLLTKNDIVSTDKKVKTTGLSQYLRQRSNTKWFSLFKVPLGIYSMAGRDTTKAVNRRLMKWGEAPIILDTVQLDASCTNLALVMKNRGYLNSEVVPTIKPKGKRVKILYTINPKERYTLKSLNYEIADHRIDSLLRAAKVLSTGSAIKVGQPFSVNDLYTERNRLTQWLNNSGFYYFNKEHITLVADTSEVNRNVDVMMSIGLYRRSSRDSLREHSRYKIRNVTFEPISGQKMKLRRSTLLNNCLLDSGDYYSQKKVQQTYNKFAGLKALRSTNIHITEVKDSLRTPNILDGELDAMVQVMRRKPHSIQIQPEATNTSGDFGAALSVTYENRNIFHGSEQLSITGRGAFEAITGLEGYENSFYKEFGVEAKLSVPRFMLHKGRSNFDRTHEASTEFPISYNIQQRPEFHRSVLRAAVRFKWKATNEKINYNFDILDLYYIRMPWISDTFKKEYLENTSSRNAILRYNYQDLFIMKVGFGFNYTDNKNILRTSIETAGNFLYALSSIFKFPKNDQNQYKVANVAFAQYVRIDADYTHLFKLDTRNTLALHARFGIAIPYGNSSMIPFDRRYFAGGPNSVRGWNIRTLGPGGFIGKDGKIDFINQTGDIKIDLNAELRTKLFWKFQGAAFIDAGNIWTIRSYSDQPNGEFTWKSLYDQMAVAYGLGLRLDFDFFLLRLDLGMKAINPAYTTSREHFPIAHPNFKRDYALHFAVGLPF